MFLPTTLQWTAACDLFAGAETLLQMASIFRRHSTEYEASSLKRGDFITGNTPPKRSPGCRPDTRLSDKLSPSPFKKPRGYSSQHAGDRDQHDFFSVGDGCDAGPHDLDFVSRLAAAQDDDDDDGDNDCIEDDVDDDGERSMSPDTDVRPSGRNTVSGFGPPNPSGFCPAAHQVAGNGVGGRSPAPQQKTSILATPSTGGMADAGFMSPPHGHLQKWCQATPSKTQQLMSMLASPSFDCLAGKPVAVGSQCQHVL